MEAWSKVENQESGITEAKEGLKGQGSDATKSEISTKKVSVEFRK